MPALKQISNALYLMLQHLTRWDLQEQAQILRASLRWVALAVIVGLLAGSASALFLVTLDAATGARERNGWLLWLLPVAGWCVGYVYKRWGAGAENGNNLVLDNIHADGGRVPLRMAPFVLGGTVLTHLFGGSAGREGTAVQMGASLADWVTRTLKLTPEDRRVMLMAGVSAGFGSVFGTPVAGTIFGMEVLRVGAMRYRGPLACLVAAFSGDWTTTAWGVGHSHYAVAAPPAISALLFGKTMLLGLASGLAALLFAAGVHGFKDGFGALVPNAAWRPVWGGALVIGLTYLVGTRDYLGLSLPLLAESFQAPAAGYDFALKILFTTITLGAGFLGGEVTPLFVVGGTLGSALSVPLGLPVDLAAAVGFAAVFAAAANTPLACAVMAVELFGGGTFPYATVACMVAYLVSGHTGIYGSQRIGEPKDPRLPHPEGTALHAIHEQRGSILPWRRP